MCKNDEASLCKITTASSGTSFMHNLLDEDSLHDQFDDEIMAFYGQLKSEINNQTHLNVVLLMKIDMYTYPAHSGKSFH